LGLHGAAAMAECGAMAQAWEFFEHTADIGVRVRGATLEELFVHAARAMFAALGELAKADGRRQKQLRLQAPSLEDLLHDWLAELLFEAEANHVLYDEVVSLKVAPAFSLDATLAGGPIDFGRSETNEEIKAVTYHHLRVERLPDQSWQATVIFDV
jgi:SHS2 domain-containing protein